MIKRGGQRQMRDRRKNMRADYEFVPSPDGRRIMKGCMIALPLSAALWWLILRAASAMI